MRLTPPTGIMDGADPLGEELGRQGGTSMSVEENMTLARRFIQHLAYGLVDFVEFG